MKLPTFNWLDIVVLVVMGLFVLRNAWIGFLRGLSSLLGLVAGYLLATRYGGIVEGILAPWLQNHWLKPTAFALTFLLVFLAIFVVTELLARLLKDLRLSWIDHLLGAGLGLLKGFFLLSLIFLLLVTFYPRTERLFQNAVTYPYLVSGARFLASIFPAEWKSRFNYNLRHFFQGRKNSASR